jgi:guanylate kinase
MIDINKSKKKTIITIIGRSGVGKDYIAKRLSTILNYPLVVSHTTRPIRSNETNGVEHWFDSKEEFQNVLDNQTVIAYTKIGEYEYCATLEDIEDNCIYVIDPLGIKYLQEHFKDQINLKIIYIYCDEYIRRARASTRSDFKIAWEDRNKAEDEQFTEFEANRPWNLLIDNSHANLNMDWVKKQVKWMMERETKNGI